MRAAAIPLVLTLFATGCAGPAGTQYRTSLPEPGVAAPFPVVLGDQTELVVGIEPAEAMGFPPFELAVHEDPVNASAIIATWIGGACDDEAALTFRRDGPGFSLHLQVRRGWGACTMAGISRTLRILTSSPIPLDSIRPSGGE
jgi:hypothetical protein